jgi:hypothetical protein
MISSQVQDITAQQIASVNHLIESVQGKLSTLLGQLDADNLPELTDAQKIAIKKVAFDPNAVYTKAGERQHIADDILAGRDVFSQAADDILQQKSEPKKESGSEPATPEPPAVDFDVASQDDIDALFK